jgi:hypothetical protein
LRVVGKKAGFEDVRACVAEMWDFADFDDLLLLGMVEPSGDMIEGILVEAGREKGIGR